ncbi:hypothetical protein NL108_018622 [Boleophthalmus pectinirostris]|nr:hypothetical protein NL108_018622 [Boleophthalmus pectinirostris]
MEKENALVTLLDPTAVSELETVDPQTQISEEEPEERLLIITHEVESVTETRETGELVRSGITATESSFVTTFPNVLPENVEDPTPEISEVTPETKEKEVVLESTTLSELTGQPPTQELIDEQENAIPDEVKSPDLGKSGEDPEETNPEFDEILEETEIVEPDLREASTKSPGTDSETSQGIERGDGTVLIREEVSEDSEEELPEILTPTETIPEIFEGTEAEIEQEAKGEVEIVTKPQEEEEEIVVQTPEVVVHPKEEEEEEAVVQKPEVEIVVRPKQEVDDISEPQQEVEITETKSEEEEEEETVVRLEEEDIVVVLPSSEEDAVVQTESPKTEDIPEQETTEEDMFVVRPTSGRWEM